MSKLKSKKEEIKEKINGIGAYDYSATTKEIMDLVDQAIDQAIDQAKQKAYQKGREDEREKTYGFLRGKSELVTYKKDGGHGVAVPMGDIMEHFGKL